MAVGKPAEETLFEPLTEMTERPAKSEKPMEFYFDVDDFVPLLSYDHANKAELDSKVEKIIDLLKVRSVEPKIEKYFTIPAEFLIQEKYKDLGTALILWLRLVIEQQRRKGRIKESDSTIAKWLRTSRFTVIRYKHILNKLGYLNLDTTKRNQKISVRYFVSMS
jgi:hypothetical protein